MKKILTITVVAVIVIGAAWFFEKENLNDDKKIVSDYRNATYIVDGRKITLQNGVSEIEISSSSVSKIVTRYFGNEVKHDLNDDGREDVVFLLTQETGGSGTFFYVVAALNMENGYVGSEAIFLGDRIAPQTTNMDEGITALGTNRKNVVVINYADRLPNEPFTVKPSMGKSLWLKLDPLTMRFGVVEVNFAGEADTRKMNLTMKKWAWVGTKYNNDTEIKPNVENKFLLTFRDDKTFSASTDCNGLGGEYFISGNKVSFSKMISTLMYCEGSQEQEFTKMLAEIDNYMFTPEGELILGLKFDSGSVIFR